MRHVKMDGTAQLEAVQTHLNGVWRDKKDGCPHIHLGDIDCCDANEMRPCVYETGDGRPCEIFKEILEEWRRELLNEELHGSR